MNWKLWRWAAARREEKRILQEALEAEYKLRQSLVRVRDELKEISVVLAFARELKLHPPDEGKIVSGLMVVDEQHPVWVAVHRLLDVMEREEQAAALRPGLSDADRAYNNGRAACVADVRAMLLQQWVKSRVSNRASK